MTKFSDTQLILLSTASQRDNHSILPLPATLTAGPNVNKAIAALVRKSLAEEREEPNLAILHCTDADLRKGMFITEAGLAAIGIGEGPAAPPPEKSGRITKASLLVDLLSRETGASLDDMTTATDWLPHTVRAALTGLRKKGYALSSLKTDGKTYWFIVDEADVEG